MTVCNTTIFPFSSCKGRKVEVNFDGGHITSNSGALLLKQVDELLDLTNRVSNGIKDPRRKESCDHTQLDLIRQRVYGIALGYEDLNDHDSLRSDMALQTAVNRDNELASSPTLSRLENRIDQDAAWHIHDVLFQTFVESFDTPPEELVLDFDGTDDPAHGDQVGIFFNSYYDHYCFFPLYVFCGTQLLVAYLRPANSGDSNNAWAILSLLVKRLRTIWPNVRIIFRGDSGFCRHQMFNWCEKNGVDYITGIAQNSRLDGLAANIIQKAEEHYSETREKQRLFSEFQYAAKTWKIERRIIVKAEHTVRGKNTRYIVTTLQGDSQHLYEDVYCARGEMENRIKEQQLYLFADRTSCTQWWPNQFRLLLSGLAYTLLEAIRRKALAGTALENARCDTIRLKLLKVGSAIIRNTRRIRFFISTAYPLKDLFIATFYKLRPGLAPG